MPENSRLWVYQADRPFTQEEEIQITLLLEKFISQWAAHGAELKASSVIIKNQFIIIAVDEGHNAASGCSIDASVGLIRSIEQKFQLSLLDRTKVAIDHGNEINIYPFNALKQKIADGTILPNSTVFNNTVQSVGEWKANWKQEAKMSWMGRFFN